MTDQCMYCTVRGDIERCLATNCFHHDNWISEQHHKRFAELTVEVGCLKYIIRRLLDELPQNRDWLDPDLEKSMKNAAYKEGGQNG